MKRLPPAFWDRCIDLALLWSLALLAGSGLVLAYRLGNEYATPSGATIWGMDWRAWADLHRLMGFVLLGLISMHLTRKWRWGWQVACGRQGVWLLLMLVITIVLLLGPLLSG